MSLYVYRETESVGPLLKRLITHVEVLMASVDDLKAKVDALGAKVTDEETAIGGVVTLLNGLTAIIADLKAQLGAAGTDPAKLQAVSDSLDALATKVDADKQKLADATVANTPAA